MHLGLNYVCDFDENGTCRRCGTQIAGCYCKAPLVRNVTLSIDELALLNPQFLERLSEVVAEGDIEDHKYRWHVEPHPEQSWQLEDLRIKAKSQLK